MKVQGFILLAIFLNIFGNGNSMAINQNETQSSWGRVFGGYLIPRDSDYKQAFTVLIAYFEDKTMPFPSNVCSGSIITENYIVSTAFCFSNTGLTLDGFAVLITGLQGTRFERTITETHIHRDYDETTLQNNIGLGKVNEPYDFTTGELSPVLLPKEKWDDDRFTGNSLTVCGHRDPYTKKNYYVLEPTCFVFIPRTRQYCTETYALTLASNEICATSSNVKKFSVCEYDFGAGLIYVDRNLNFYLYAIASYSTPYRCGKGPTAYYLVNSALKWIKKKVE